MENHSDWLALLAEVELGLPARIASKDFRTMHVTYARPHVERLFFQHGEYRVFLHLIEQCHVGDALWHNHPWPSIVKVLDSEGRHYINTFDKGDGLKQDRVIATPENPYVYSMLSPKDRHSVGVELGSWSIMITGPRWGDPEPSRFQPQIEPLRFEYLLQMWGFLYPHD